MAYMAHVIVKRSGSAGVDDVGPVELTGKPVLMDHMHFNYRGAPTNGLVLELQEVPGQMPKVTFQLSSGGV